MRPEGEAFLAAAGWAGAARLPLAGDASSRRYERLIRPDGVHAILMLTEAGSLGPFLRIAAHLEALGLSTPQIFADDDDSGLMLLEDLGDGLFARQLEADPSRETEFYLAATDLLIALQAAPPPEAPDYGAEAMVAAIAPLADYAAGAEPLQAALAEAFAALPDWQPVLALRDYHAENLFWLPERRGLARVGLIDFQDAVLSHPLYDLVSLSRDIRRNVAPETAAAMLARFGKARGEAPEALAQAAATVAVQRNLRILGIFARLIGSGKPRYAQFLPAVWERLMEDLAHPALDTLRQTALAHLPPPEPDLIKRLMAR